jgi:putative Ca2+/H+ antiporter (TMEM165/GDT1 family)
VFVVTLIAFFLAEIGDKTQIATAMLAAKFDSLPSVVAGTTLGMLLVDVPTAFIGKAAAERIPFRAVRIVAAALFAGLGVWVLVAPGFAG